MRIPDEIQDPLEQLLKKYLIYADENPGRYKKRGDGDHALDSYMLEIPASEYCFMPKSHDVYSLDLTPGKLINETCPQLDMDDVNEIIDIYEEINHIIGGNWVKPLLTFYPKGGYIGWHHNADTPGQNIFVTWSEDGGGIYKTWNNLTKEFEYYTDNKGWTIKSHNYRGWDEVDEKGYSWHAMETNSRRLSVAFIIPEYDTGLGDVIKEIFEIKGSPSVNGVYSEGAN